MRGRRRAAIQPRRQRQNRATQRPLARLARIRLVGFIDLHRRKHRRDRVLRMLRQRQFQRLAGGPDCLRVRGGSGLVQGGGQFRLTRQGQHQGAVRRVKRIIAQHAQHAVQIDPVRGTTARRHLHQRGAGQHPSGLPAVERIGVIGQQESASGSGQVKLKDHRRGKATQDRRHRLARQPVKGKALVRLRHLQHPGCQHLLAIRADQPDLDRDHLWLRVRAGSTWRGGLAETQGIAPVRPVFLHLQARGAGLGIPALELAQVAPRHLLKHRQPVLDGAGLPVMAGKIQLQRPGPGGIAHQPFQHADHLGPLFIDRGGVKVVDLLKAGRAHGMGQGAVVLGELTGAQGHHVADPLDRGAAHVGGELGIAKHRQPLFQAQLEPVAAGDAVAGPVVEILMRDDRLDALEIAIGRGLGAGQHGRGVEDVQPLVLHRPHVEIIDRDDVEHLQVVFAPVNLLVPEHRLFQRRHAKGAFALVPGPHPEVQRHIAPRTGGEAVAMRHQIARHQGKQIGRFGPWIMPFGPALAGRHRVAVGQQHRVRAIDPHGEYRHHIGAVGVIGDLAKAFGLALAAVHGVVRLQTFACAGVVGSDVLR